MLKQSTSEERDRLLISAVDDQGNVNIAEVDGQEEATQASPHNHDDQDREHDKDVPRRLQPAAAPDAPLDSSEDEMDIAHFVSVDDAGKPSSFGPSSALHDPSKSDKGFSPSQRLATVENARNCLIANAALQRQLEHSVMRTPLIDGISTELAMHLLNIHWARQHHTFLLTYRPAVMRDVQKPGEPKNHCSVFMLNAIFACASKFSPRLELRDDADDALSAGRRFFRRCDDLLANDNLLTRPHITTIVGLLLLGSTFNARGETSKGWLYTGYALRMVYDLGLHLDPTHTTDNAEEIEIKRRVFWGAFVCDKLQSLYLGRPVAINLRDSQVSRNLLDTYEENEAFIPQHVLASSPGMPEGTGDVIPLHSVSTFQQLCMLAKIMTSIINRFYVVGATFLNAQNSLQHVDHALQQWRQNLVPELDFQPWLSSHSQPPNVMVLHNLYHSLIILVHRPFISDGHLRSAVAPARSWEKCTVAARSITSIALTYKSAYTLSGAPYVLGYTIYVACTIHVRNAASQDQHAGEHLSLLKASLSCLDDLCVANPGVTRPADIIRRLISANSLDIEAGSSQLVHQPTLNFDLNAILSMFPGNSANMDCSMPAYRMELDYGLPLDPLFGLMDVPTGPFGLETDPLPMVNE
ncbi:Nitrogen assimilation transcription factor nirA [Paramyrothecium foliicola]|nr:Nitrogen assimilation transcription factor nirA [Paramyrothecium foliicola]